MSVEGLEDLEEVEQGQDTGGSSSSSEEEVIITKRVRKKKKKLPLPIPPEPITEEMKNAVMPTKNTKNFKIVDGKNHSEDEEEDDKEIQKPKAKPYKKADGNDGRKKKERTPAHVKAWEKA